MTLLKGTLGVDPWKPFLGSLKAVLGTLGVDPWDPWCGTLGVTPWRLREARLQRAVQTMQDSALPTSAKLSSANAIASNTYVNYKNNNNQLQISAAARG